MLLYSISLPPTEQSVLFVSDFVLNVYLLLKLAEKICIPNILYIHISIK